MFDGGAPIPETPPKWVPYYAWWPTTVHGKLVWFKPIFRREIRTYGDRRLYPPLYEYGNLFDVIRDA